MIVSIRSSSLLVYRFLIISILSVCNAEHIKILNEFYTIDGETIYFNMDLDDHVMDFFNSSGSFALSESTDFEFSVCSAGRFFIENSCISNSEGHMHMMVKSESNSSAEWTFKPLIDGIYFLTISGLFEWEAQYGMPQESPLDISLKKLNNNQILFSKSFKATDFISDTINYATFSEGHQIALLSTDLYMLHLEGYIGPNQGPFIQEHHLISTDLQLIPENSTITFLFFSLFALLIWKNKNNEKLHVRS